jgi:hypothetical protein
MPAVELAVAPEPRTGCWSIRLGELARPGEPWRSTPGDV